MKFQIVGDPTPVVICHLEAGESMTTESGSMVWMSPNMKMETNAGGGLKKAFGRMLSGESIFILGDIQTIEPLSVVMDSPASR